MVILLLWACHARPHTPSDVEVVQNLVGVYGLGEPESFIIGNDNRIIEFRYDRQNLYVQFKRTEGRWSVYNMGYIKRPKPTVDEIKWLWIMVGLELQRMREKSQFTPLDEDGRVK